MSLGGTVVPPGNINFPFKREDEFASGSRYCIAMNLLFCTLSTINRGTRSPLPSKVTFPVIPSEASIKMLKNRLPQNASST